MANYFPKFMSGIFFFFLQITNKIFLWLFFASYTFLPVYQSDHYRISRMYITNSNIEEEKILLNCIPLKMEVLTKYFHKNYDTNFLTKYNWDTTRKAFFCTRSKAILSSMVKSLCHIVHYCSSMQRIYVKYAVSISSIWGLNWTILLNKTPL